MGELLLINPRKRGTRKTAKKRKLYGAAAAAVARKRNPVKKLAGTRLVKRHVKKTAKRRRNPISVRGTNISALLIDGLIGSAGAAGVNMLSNMIPLPAAMKTGAPMYATRALLGVAVAVFGRKLLGARAMAAGQGAITVAGLDLIKSLAPAAIKAQLGDADEFQFLPVPTEYLSGIDYSAALPDYSGNSDGANMSGVMQDQYEHSY